MKITGTAKKHMLMATLAGLASKAYENYKLMWMKKHGYSFEDLLYYLDTAYEDAVDDNDGMCGISPSKAMEVVEEIGLDNGEIWVSRDEFLGNEFQDSEIVKELLDDEQFKDYEEMMKVLKEGAEQ